MVKKFIIIALLGLLTLSIIATQEDDFKFIYGLFLDSNYQIAKGEISRFERTYPNSEFSPIVHFISGDINFAEKNYAKALEIYNETLKQQLDEELRGEVLLKKIQSLYHLNKYEAMRAEKSGFEKTYPKHESRWIPYYWNAKSLLNENKYQECYDQIVKAEKITLNADILSVKVRALIQLGDDSKTGVEMARLIESYPQHQSTDYAYVKWFDYNYQNKTFTPILERTYRLRNKSLYYNDYLMVLAETYYDLDDYSTTLDVLNRMTEYPEKKRFYQALAYEGLGRIDEAKNNLTRLYESAKQVEIKYNSFYKLIDILSLSDPNSALNKVQSFVNKKTNSPYFGTVLYQQAQIYYLMGKYPDALNSLIQTWEYRLNPNVTEKTKFLFGDIYYMLERYDDAQGFFDDYITLYPNGLFTAEVYFKLGMCNLAKRDWNNSEKWFKLVVKDYPQTEKASTATYYLGEVKFLNGKYRDAIVKFEEAVNLNFEKDVAAERIAHSYYFNGQYEKAMKAVESIPEMEPYLFDKYMLQGNVEFNRDNHQFALIYYQIAKKYATEPKELELVLSQTAWTYYKLERYDQAKETFLLISKSKSSSPEKYLLLAGNAAFNYEDYKQAIQIYQSLVKDYKKSPLATEAKLGIANAYYNLGNYGTSIKEFSKILEKKPKKKTSNVVIDGIYWNMLRDTVNDYRDQVSKTANKVKSDDVKHQLYSIILKWEVSKKKWPDAVKTGDKLINHLDYPGDENANLLLYAEALKQVKEYDKAETLFTKSIKKDGNGKIQLQLAEMYLAKGDTLSAITNLRDILNQKAEYSAAIKLLKISRISNNKLFVDDYTQVLSASLTTDYAEARLEMIEWQIDHKHTKEAEKELNKLLRHETKSVRAQAQFLVGKRLLRNKKYQDAIPELLRVKYIYPNFKDIVLKAEYYVTICYIRSGNKDEGKKVFSLIKDELSASKRANLEGMLK